jgi:hypothetical protein
MRGTNHRRLLLTEKCRPCRDGDIVLKIPFMRERTPTGDFDQAEDASLQQCKNCWAQGLSHLLMKLSSAS